LDLSWRDALLLQELPHHLQSRLGVAFRLHQEIQNLSFIIDGTTQPLPSTSNDKNQLIDTPVVACSGPHSPQIECNLSSEFQKPAPNGFIGNVQAAFHKKVFYVSIAQRKPGVEPDSVENDLWRKSVALQEDGFHPVVIHKNSDKESGS